ncbi:hypothetical protein HPP92_016923 [Vanilla planifolia]|uniref:protein-serine/threonine phosphatase n=1 Tax=Vanilla planifolia TaxID=51239 RepID=A0A835QK98_VANPL|nr:hypothetical protein HPP92_016923 [Vanilla planifolia]
MEERYTEARSTSRESDVGEGISMGRRPFQSGDLGLSPILSETEPRDEQQAMASASMAASLVGLFILMLFLLLLLFVLACRPWRFLCRRRTFASSTFKADDIERPLFAENLIDAPEQNHDLTRNSVEESSIEVDGSIYSPRTLAVVGDVNFPRKHGLLNKKRISTNVKISAGDSLVLDVPCDTSQDIQVVQTLNWAPISSSPCEGVNHVRGKDDTTILPLTLGRVSPSDLILKDSEVSGRHAFIDWNTHKSKWELVDMGSLNGTFLNSKAIHHPVAGSRQCSEPIELSTGDIITLGSFSKISVQIRLGIKHESSFGVGIASDPMAMRRGGKKLPMEDMFTANGPFLVLNRSCQNGKQTTSTNHSRHFVKSWKEREVFSCCDATDVLKEAFALTEAALNHQYEGCTATVLLVWFMCNEVFAQCANVGDSACILNVNGKDFMMTEDHRVSSILERARLNQSGSHWRKAKHGYVV